MIEPCALRIAERDATMPHVRGAFNRRSLNEEQGLDPTADLIAVGIALLATFTFFFHLYLWWIGAYRDLFLWFQKQIWCCCCNPAKIAPAIEYAHVEVKTRKMRMRKKKRRKWQPKRRGGNPTGHELVKAWDHKHVGEDEWTKKIAEVAKSTPTIRGEGAHGSGPGM